MGKVLARDDVRSVGLSAEEAVDGRRTITQKDHQRVWRSLPLGLLSNMESSGESAVWQFPADVGGVRIPADEGWQL